MTSLLEITKTNVEINSKIYIEAAELLAQTADKTWRDPYSVDFDKNRVIDLASKIEKAKEACLLDVGNFLRVTAYTQLPSEKRNESTDLYKSRMEASGAHFDRALQHAHNSLALHEKLKMTKRSAVTEVIGTIILVATTILSMSGLAISSISMAVGGVLFIGALAFTAYTRIKAYSIKTIPYEPFK